jgi:hypothetical protein
MMRSKLIICLLVFLVAAAFTIEAAETPKFVPDSCISVVTVSNAQNDPGISWLLDAWINSPRESPLREFFKSTAAKEMSVAVFPKKGDSPLYLLFVVNFAKGAKINKDVMNNVIMPDPDAKLQSVSYKGATINFVSVDTPEDFSAYTVLQDKVLFGSDVDVLKEALDGPSVEKSSGYQNVRAQFPQAKDGLLFADNKGSKFLNFLQPLEKKWKMTLLLSAEYLEWMGSSFDVINSTRVAGKFVFQGKDTSYIEDIQDDAEFLGEVFKRKFIAEKIDYSSEVEVKDRTVVLNFQIDGIEPLWKKLFAQGVLSLIRPESAE